VRCEQCHKRPASRLTAKNRCPGCGFLLCETCHPEGSASECSWCGQQPKPEGSRGAPWYANVVKRPRHATGTWGVIIRHRHGWEDGKIRAVIIADNGEWYTARDPLTGAKYEIGSTRDFRAEPSRS
jgi:hypothetical protein